MLSVTQRAMTGALKVIQECLTLDQDTPLAIFCDETTVKVAEVLRAAAEKVQVPVRVHPEPLDRQRAFRPEAGLSLSIRERLEECQAVITCLAADPESTPFRLELVRQATHRDKRVGHMPGVTLDVLAYAVNIDYNSVQQKCDDLAFALTAGSTARLTTYRSESTSEVLELDLGGFDRSAVLSTGIVEAGTWGNLPGGETFIAPMEGKAEGRFVLNGAFNSHVMGRGTALVLEFKKGTFTRIVSGPAAVVTKFERLLENANSNKNDSWRTLAELGVGVNDGIRKLTGNSLFDEKCLGTVHIAIGDNSTFGGRSESDCHEDLVTLRPSLQVDGKPILDRGRYVFDSAQWREDIDTHPIHPDLQAHGGFVMKGLIGARERGGALVVERRISDGRMNRYTVGNTHTTPILAAVYTDIPEGPFKIELKRLWRAVQTKSVKMSYETLMRGLSILAKHRLIAVTGA